MIKNIRLLISPFFLPRYYLQHDIGNIVRKYKIKGLLFDIGCGTKPYRNLFPEIAQYIGIDFKNSYATNKDFISSSPDLFFDSNYIKNFTLPCKKNAYDCTVAFQVVEHHKNPRKLLEEMVRITKPNGYILFTLPFLGGIHERPNDFQRLTYYGIKNLFAGLPCKILLIKNQGGFFSTISTLCNEEINTIASRNRLFYVICTLLFIPFLLFSYTAFILDKIYTSDNIVLNYLVVAKKK